MKRIIYILVLLLAYSGKLCAQENNTIQGIVFDADSRQRLTRVYIFNLNSGQGFYNNTKGEFKTTAKEGDVLVAALQGYGVDTISIKSESTILFYLRRNSIQLDEVVIRDSIGTPHDRLKSTQEEYKTAYSRGTVKDVLTIGKEDGRAGVGLSIDALYSLLSKEGRNARMLQKIIERDYRNAMIDYRFTNSLVSKVTGLSGEKLTDFRQQYRPGYYFVLEASDYELIRYIQRSFQAYLEDPAALRLPSLKTSMP